MLEIACEFFKAGRYICQVDGGDGRSVRSQSKAQRLAATMQAKTQRLAATTQAKIPEKKRKAPVMQELMSTAVVRTPARRPTMATPRTRCRATTTSRSARAYLCLLTETPQVAMVH